MSVTRTRPSGSGRPRTGSAHRAAADPANRPRSWLRSTRTFVLGLAAGLLTTTVLPGLVGYTTPGLVERGVDPSPLRASLGYDLDVISDGWSIATPARFGPADMGGAARDDESLRQWLLDHEGAYVGETTLLLTLEGRRSQGVTVRNVRLRVLDRAAPHRGTRVVSASAGAEDVQALGFDLDTPAPVARTVDATSGDLGEPYFSGSFITLAKNEVMVLQLRARTTRCACTWEVVVDVMVDGNTESTTVGEGSYATTARAPSYASDLQWRWDLQPARLVPAA